MDEGTLKVVVSSGYSEEIMNSGKPKNPAIVFLAKPYDIKTLAATVRRCMNRAGAAGYHARSSLVVGLLFAVCTGLLLTYQLTKARTLQMADELAERRKQPVAVALPPPLRRPA